MIYWYCQRISLNLYPDVPGSKGLCSQGINSPKNWNGNKKQIHVLAYYNKIIKLKDTMYTKKKILNVKGSTKLGLLVGGEFISKTFWYIPK